MANELATQMPELGVAPIEITKLSSELEGPARDVAEKFKKAAKPKATTTTETSEEDTGGKSTYTVESAVDEYLRRMNDNDKSENLELEQFIANNAEEINFEFTKRKRAADRVMITDLLKEISSNEIKTYSKAELSKFIKKLESLNVEGALNQVRINEALATLRERLDEIDSENNSDEDTEEVVVTNPESP
jgi:hypothetical protein